MTRGKGGLKGLRYLMGVLREGGGFGQEIEQLHPDFRGLTLVTIELPQKHARGRVALSVKVPGCSNRPTLLLHSVLIIPSSTSQRSTREDFNLRLEQTVRQ